MNYVLAVSSLLDDKVLKVLRDLGAILVSRELRFRNANKSEANDPAPVVPELFIKAQHHFDFLVGALFSAAQLLLNPIHIFDANVKVLTLTEAGVVRFTGS